MNRPVSIPLLFDLRPRMPLQRGQIMDVLTSSRDFGIDGRAGDAPTQIRRSDKIVSSPCFPRVFHRLRWRKQPGANCGCGRFCQSGIPSVLARLLENAPQARGPAK
jgi:hypothetical protein